MSTTVTRHTTSLSQATGTSTSRGMFWWVCASLLTLALLFLLALQYAKYASTFDTRAQDRYGILTQHWADTIEAQLALGLSITESQAVARVLHQAKNSTNGLFGIGVLNPQGELLQSNGVVSLGLWQQAHVQTLSRTKGVVEQHGITALALPLQHAFGERAGTLVLSYDHRPIRAKAIAAFHSLWPWVLGAWCVGLVVLGCLMRWMTPVSDSAHPVLADPSRKLTWTLTMLLFGSQLMFAWHAMLTLQQVIQEDSPMLSQALMQTISPTWERAMQHDIPLSGLVGVEPWLDAALDIGPEFAGIQVLSAKEKQVLYQAGTVHSDYVQQSHILTTSSGSSYPEVTTQWTIALNPDALTARSRQLVVEFLMVLLASVVIFGEVLKSFARHIGQTKSVSTHSQTSQTTELRADDLRVPLFLFFFASELPRAFLPVWSQDVAQLPLWPRWMHVDLMQGFEFRQHISSDILTSLPISLYLLSFALVSPWAGRLCAQYGARRLFLSGLGLAGMIHLLTIFIDSWGMLCIVRVLAGASVGMVSVAALDFIAHQTDGRAAGMAMYLTTYVGAGIAGAGLGAVLADQIGISAVFLLAAVLVAWTWGLVWNWPSMTTSPMSKLPSKLAADYTFNTSDKNIKDKEKILISPQQLVSDAHRRGIVGLLSHSVIWRLLLCMALPMQLAQNGLLFYWVPLALAGLGEHTSMTGMAMMGYFFAVLMLNRWFAQHADRSGQHTTWVIVGLLLMGIMGVLMGRFYTSWVLVLGVVLIGVAWAACFPSQGAILLKIAKEQLPEIEPSVAIGNFRTLERMAGMLSPLVVGASIAYWGAVSTAMGLGLVLLSAACALLLYQFRTHLSFRHRTSHSSSGS